MIFLWPNEEFFKRWSNFSVQWFIIRNIYSYDDYFSSDTSGGGLKKKKVSRIFRGNIKFSEDLPTIRWYLDLMVMLYTSNGNFLKNPKDWVLDMGKHGINNWNNILKITNPFVDFYCEIFQIHSQNFPLLIAFLYIH
ncbi:MAG: hypothetical protein CM15mV85_030 [uncultured marine virus]|nr:MAG: hypothetical protein CM15mV85_030 [uncultured marine virus]